MGTLSLSSRPAKLTAAGLAAVAVVGGIFGYAASQAPIGPTTQVLQTVDIALASGGEIGSVESTALLMNSATGATRSQQTRHELADVVDDVPVRVTTEYRTEDATGGNLDDLAGYTGRVEIDVTLENLTVRSERLTFDAVGTSRTAPALVGTPLSIAASATLPNTPQGRVDFSPETERTTNGVVTPGSDGTSATVQWGAILAPPQSPASSTLRIVADVESFTPPTFDIAVQAGLHTDLSFTGAMASAVESDIATQLGTQQQAIDLIAQVNEVLTRAGGTVTDIRTNLDDTSGTLGVRASERLAGSSRQLTTEMQSISGQISTLQTSLPASVTGASDSTKAELASIIAAMGTLLGDTSVPAPPTAEVPGCGQQPAEALDDQAQAAPQPSSVYSMLQRISALLDGYANGSEDCRARVMEQLDSAIGPEQPDAAVCQTSDSATCALFASWVSVQTTLAGLVLQGDALAGSLDDTPISNGLAAQGRLTDAFGDIDLLLADMRTGAADTAVWNRLLEQISSAEQAADDISAVRDELARVRSTLVTGPRSISRQQDGVAADVCGLIRTSPTMSQAELDAISARITGRDCAGQEVDPASLPAQGSLDSQLEAQADALDEVVAALDGWQSESPMRALNDALAELRSQAETERIAAVLGTSTSWGSVARLSRLLTTAKQHSGTVGASLTEISTDQAALGDQIRDGFADASQSAGQAVTEELGQQVDQLNAQRGTSQGELSTSYQALIDSLRASSNATVTDGAALVDGQNAQLAQQHSAATQTLDATTTAAVQAIESSTASATRNTDAAREQLGQSLDNVLLDLGTPTAGGGGILGSMAASAARAGTADYQLAEASQTAAGFANVRDDDVAGLLLRQAQFRASMQKAASLGPFHIDVPDGASSQTVYVLHLGGGPR